ncbi:MAG TPA: PAS domain-containing protein, partial [Kofleriaceae bacterium]|nr:PAS domain-containing protein [Kofleriaceae bacterium]
EFEILQFRGETGAYLAPAAGKASLNLMKMLREGLLVAVRGAVLKARKDEKSVRETGLRVKSNGGYREVDVEVLPVRGSGQGETCFVVLFEERTAGAPGPALRPAEPPEPVPASAADSERELGRTKQELAATREYLQSVIEQQEAANEELQSANEEVQSANEELQSINEELETSKEEIQSSNEELATVNDELQNRNLELGQSNNDFTNLLASVQIAIVMLGPDLRIRRFTPLAERMFNLLASDVGRPLTDIKLAIDLPSLDQMVLDVIDSVSPKECEARDRHGRWFSVRIRPYKTLENKIDGAVLMLVDIDALKRVERSLRESEGRFRELADSAAVQIWITTPEGVQFANRAYREFLGITEREVPGYDWTQFVHPADKEASVGLYADAMARRVRFETQFRLRRADAQYRWMKSVGVPRFTADGEFVGLVGCASDITDLKQAEEVLQRADRDKNEFLAMLAHELRNPLVPLRNVAEVMRQATLDKDQREWAQAVTGRQIDTMTRMIDELLDISRITQRKITLRRERLDALALLERAIEVCRPAIDERSQSLHVRLPDERVAIEGDPLRVEQIFSNLLHNASKFTPPGGNIWVTASVDGHAPARAPDPGTTTGGDGDGSGLAGSIHGDVVVSVRDDGAGIAPPLLSRIFDLFFQGDTSLARVSGGLGIGLTMVRRLAELHGGRVEARSPGPGQGSEFLVWLPSVPGKPPAPAQSLPSARQRTEARRILVVDDNNDAAETLAVLLRLSGHQVELADSGPAALKAAEAFEPEVILLDIGLPGMDGYQVARRLRQLPATREALLIAVSGYGREDDRRHSREAGFDHHLVKPADPDMLQELLTQARPRRRSRS